MGELISIKLTDKGRELLSKGELTFDYYSLGDSEVDYGTENSYVLPSLHGQQIITSFLQEQVSCNKIFPLSGCTSSRRRYISKKTGYGTFDSDIIELTNFSPEFMIMTGQTFSSPYDGSKEIDMGGAISPEQFLSISDGDILAIKVCNNDLQEPLLKGNSAFPLLFFRIKKNGISTVLTLDRPLPFQIYLDDTEFFIYPQHGEYYLTGSTIDFDGFDDACYVCSGGTLDYANMKIVHCTGLIGTSGCTADASGYTSSPHMGLMKYLGYCQECPESVGASTDCSDVLQGIYDSRANSISIIEFRRLQEDYIFVNEDNLFNLHIPHIMWHRRDFGGSGLGDVAGMSFVSDTVLKSTVDGIAYYELLESSGYTGDRTTISVGRVYPDLKIVTLHNAELVAAMTFTSNRNWTLPRLAGRMIYPINGIGNGMLAKGKTLYMTYRLTASFGVLYSFPQQVLLKFVNSTNIDRDISFTLEEGGMLPYMRKREPVTDGLGFHANNFKVLYQITDSEKDLPSPDGWMESDFTNNYLTGQPYETIDPLKLEGQDAQTNQFILTPERLNFVGSDVFTLSGHCITCEDSIIGWENMFIGNAAFSAGKSLYRKTINILIWDNIGKTDNQTYIDGDLKVSEIGIYNKNMQMVMIAKIRTPIVLMQDGPSEVELEFDF